MRSSCNEADDVFLSYEIEQEPAPTHGGKINYEAFLEGLHSIGYDGYLASEYCLPMIRNHKIAGIEEVDKATIRGMRYMKGLVEKTKGSLNTNFSPPPTSRGAIHKGHKDAKEMQA